MRIPYARPSVDRPTSAAGGTATGAEIAVAAHEQMRLVDNVNGAQAALEEAYAARSRAISDAAGVDLGNPMAIPFDPFARDLGLEPQWTVIERQRAEYAERLRKLALERPDLAEIIGADRPVERDAEGLAKGADDRLAQLMEATPGWGKYVAAFAGGGVGAMRDPITLGSLALGGGPGAARTVAGRILSTAVREATINAATEAAAQPFVQDWRRRAGLDSGFDEALANVGFAGALGFGLGAAGRGVYEGVTTGRRRQATRAQVLEAAQASGNEALQKALAGDHRAAAAMLQATRDSLPADVRGALDAVEIESAIETARLNELAKMDAARHERLQARAEIAAQMRQVPPPMTDFDEIQVARLVRELAPAPESISGYRREPGDVAPVLADLRAIRAPGQLPARPVSQFLRSIGGVDPEGRLAPELISRGINPRSFPGLFRREGLKSLDNIPLDELPPALRTNAIDDGAGYMSEEAFLNGLEAEMRGQPWRVGNEADDAATRLALEEQRAWYERQGVDFDAPDDQVMARMIEVDDAEARYRAAEGIDPELETDEAVFLPPGVSRRLHTEAVVREILEAVPGADDELVRVAAETHLFAGEAMPDAIAFAQSQRAGVPIATPPPGLDLGSAPPIVERMGGMDDPASIAHPEDTLLSAADLEGLPEGPGIPFGDELVSVEALQRSIDETAWLERVVGACKL